MPDDQVWGNLWGKNKDQQKVLDLLDILAERTGLEPATPGVTGRYSNQLNYRSAAVKQHQLQSCLASPRGFEPLYPP